MEIAPDLPIVRMDSDRMAQALGNILSNAVKFTPPGGKVSTSLKFEEGQLFIEVADTGPGIPADERENLFQPFYRGSQGRRIVEGMGLGLSIAREIIIAHGGDIALESKPGAGSRFTLHFPVEALEQVQSP
jgi:signal transduction histidine kinase